MTTNLIKLDWESRPAEYDAERAKEREYGALQVKVEAIESRFTASDKRSYLWDTGVDTENTTDAGLREGFEGFWAAMVRSAHDAVGMRASETGDDALINDVRAAGIKW